MVTQPEIRSSNGSTAGHHLHRRMARPLLVESRRAVVRPRHEIVDRIGDGCFFEGQGFAFEATLFSGTTGSLPEIVFANA